MGSDGGNRGWGPADSLKFEPRGLEIVILSFAEHVPSAAILHSLVNHPVTK